MTLIYLTPTAEWQPIQLNHAIFDIPVGWYEDFILGAPFAQFINIERSSVSIMLGEGNRPRDRGLAYIVYGESPPQEIGTDGEAVVVDGYPAELLPFEAYDENVRDLSYNLVTYTPEHTHSQQLRCLTHIEMGEVRQQEFLEMCESIVQHWVETTEILE